MRRRHPLPKLWLMTDERQGDGLIATIRRLPAGSGIVFRHYSLPADQRRRLFERARRLAHSKGLPIFLAGNERQANAWGADGWHGRGRSRTSLPRSSPAHDLEELRAAEEGGADILFVSPVFPTRSHPDAASLGPGGFTRLARSTRLPIVALGGMDRRRAAQLRRLGAYGWAAIDALSRNQKRKAVPT